MTTMIGNWQAGAQSISNGLGEIRVMGVGSDKIFSNHDLHTKNIPEGGEISKLIFFFVTNTTIHV